MSPLPCLKFMSKIPIQVKLMLITENGALRPWNLTVLNPKPRSLLWFFWETEPIYMNGLQNLNGREGLLKTPLEKVDLPTGT